MKLSVVIPTHDMDNKVFFLSRALDSLWNQTLQDFEIIVSDNSDDDELKRVCVYYGPSIQYYKNRDKGMAPNTNRAMELASGPLVKILYMDDYLAHDQALERIWNNFKGEWLVTGCLHQEEGGEVGNPHYPSWNDEIKHGNNTIGSPSVMTLSRSSLLFFDRNLSWLLDCDLYARLYEKYGEPVYLNDLNVVMGLGKHQMTHQLSEEEKLAEYKYLQ